MKFFIIVFLWFLSFNLALAASAGPSGAPVAPLGASVAPSPAVSGVSPAPALGVTQKSNFDFSANSKLPIVINADSLQVYQDKSMAVFTGNVIADQGQMHLKSDVMTVFYANSDDKKAQQAASPNGKVNSIKRINVDGHVFVTSPEETARGKTGYYDTVKNFLELTGDVVLTKDNDVLHGAKMDYDMNTGYSILTPDKAINNGRVRGLFMPEDANNGAPKQ